MHDSSIACLVIGGKDLGVFKDYFLLPAAGSFFPCVRDDKCHNPVLLDKECILNVKQESLLEDLLIAIDFQLNALTLCLSTLWKVLLISDKPRFYVQQRFS